VDARPVSPHQDDVRPCKLHQQASGGRRCTTVTSQASLPAAV